MFRFAGVSARRRSIAVVQGLYWHQIYGSMGDNDARYVYMLCSVLFCFVLFILFIYLFVCFFFSSIFFFFSFVSTGAQVPAQSISVLCYDMIGRKGRSEWGGVGYGWHISFSARSKPKPRLIPSTARPSFLSDQHSPDHSSRPTAAACPN